MRTLFISNDPTIFDTGSDTHARMKSYARAIGELHIVSRAEEAPEEAYGGGVRFGQLALYAVRGGKLRCLPGLIERARDIVLLHGIQVVSAQDPFELGYAAFRAVQGTNAKLHVQVHTDFLSPWFVKGRVLRSANVRMPFLNRIRRGFADTVLPQADGIRVVSERIKESLQKRYGGRIPEPSVIPIAVTRAFPAPVALPPRPFTFTFLTAGRLEPEKRIEDIIDALARIHLKYQAAGLLIVGEGRSRTLLERKVRALGLTEHVQFLGWRTDLAGLIQSAQCYIQASGYEGYGRTLIEAALAEVPIITTDVGIVGEVFVGYEDVLAAPPGDPAALAVHMVGIIEDMQARRNLAMSAKRKAQEHLALYEDLPTCIAADLARLVENDIGIPVRTP